MTTPGATPTTHPDPGSPLARSTALADEIEGSGAALTHAEAANALPTSFGVFKPVGHVMMGLPTQAQVTALVTALRNEGWRGSALRQFSPVESAAELQAMVEQAGLLSGFGHELKALKRYVSLTAEGYRWLLVQADDAEHAERAARIARDCGATLAIYYRTLTIEDLIPGPGH